MQNTLFIFNYQREIPPFMIAEIEVAVKKFDRVYYTSPSLTNSNIFPPEKYPNLKFLYLPVSQRKYLVLKAFFNLFSPDFHKQMLACGPSIAVVKALSVEHCVVNAILFMAQKDIEKELRDGNRVHILAAWFNACAVAAAKIKEKYPQVRAESLAHAFEITAARNVFRNRAWAEMKHSLLDAVHFISAVKLENYYKSLSHLNIKERFGKKLDVTYLGSSNPTDAQNPEPADNQTFHIVTCSRTAPEKRLERLVETLTLWHGQPLKWTHIGSGPCDDKIHELAEKLMAENPDVQVEFLGYKTNAEVLDYFSSTPVHLFVNVSDTEGLPVSVMEAASFGIPGAATDVGGTRELITPEMGWLEPADFKAKAFLQHLKDFANLPAERRQAMRRAAQKIWAEKFNAATNHPRLFDRMLQNTAESRTK